MMKNLGLFLVVLFTSSFGLFCASGDDSPDDSGLYDADGVHDGESSCIDLEWTVHNGKIDAYDLVWPDCAERDGVPVKAWIVRDIECYEKGMPLQQLPEAPDFGSHELVALCDTFGGCGWDIRVRSVVDCGSNVEIYYEVIEPCATCDAVMPDCIFILIPNDPLPIDAHADLVMESPCP